MSESRPAARAPTWLRRFMAALLAVACMAAASATAAAADPDTGQFTDIREGHPAAQAIAWCYGKNVIGGYPDGTFRPDADVSNRGFRTMLTRAFGAYDETDPDRAHAGPLTRYGAALLITAITDRNGIGADAFDRKAAESEIADYNKIPEEYRQAVVNVHAMGVMKGLSDGAFHGSETVTRAQAAVIVRRTAAAFGEAALVMPPRLTNGKEITQKNVTDMITKLKSEWPSNRDFPGYSKLSGGADAGANSIRKIVENYVVTGTKDDKCSTDTGCGGWAAFVCDYIFGQDAEFHKTTLDKIRPGDLMLKLDSAGKLAHVQVYVSPVHGQRPDQSVRITNANNGLGVPTAAGTTAYKTNWTNASTRGVSFDVWTAYPD